MAHCELARALWEAETSECIPGTSWCNLQYLHPALANTSAGRHSVGLLWLRDGPGETFKVLLMEAGQNDNSRTHQQQSLIFGELVSEVPVHSGHLWSMPSLVWPSLLSKLVDSAKNGSSLIVSLSLAIQVLLKAM